MTPPVGAAISPLGVPVHDEALLQWRRWCETHEGRHVRLGLSARWLLSTALPHDGRRPDGPAQAQAEAASRWAHFLGLDDAAWQARWVTRAVPMPQGVLVCAVPRVLVDDVLAVAARHHVTVQWLGPWWAQGLTQWLTQGDNPAASRALVMRETGWAVHVQASGAQVTQLWGEPDGGEPAAGTQTLWLKSADTDAAAPGQPLVAQVMVGHVGRKERWFERFDFKPVRPRAAAWAWALLGAGLLSVLWLADQADQLQQRQTDAQAQLQRLARADRQVRLERAVRERASTAQAPLAAASAPVLSPAAADEAVAMVRALAFPWPETLRRMELSASNAGAVMLSMSTSLDEAGRAVGPTWRLQAAVPDDAAALGWAASLPSGRLITRASLATPFATSHGPYGLKAEVQAQPSWASLMETVQ